MHQGLKRWHMNRGAKKDKNGNNIQNGFMKQVPTSALQEFSFGVAAVKKRLTNDCLKKKTLDESGAWRGWARRLRIGRNNWRYRQERLLAELKRW